MSEESKLGKMARLANSSCVICDDCIPVVTDRDRGYNSKNYTLSQLESKALCKVLRLPLFPFDFQFLQAPFCKDCKTYIKKSSVIFDQIESLNLHLTQIRSVMQNKLAKFATVLHSHTSVPTNLEEVNIREKSVSDSSFRWEIRKQVFCSLQANASKDVNFDFEGVRGISQGMPLRVQKGLITDCLSKTAKEINNALSPQSITSELSHHDSHPSPDDPESDLSSQQGSSLTKAHACEEGSQLSPQVIDHQEPASNCETVNLESVESNDIDNADGGYEKIGCRSQRSPDNCEQESVQTLVAESESHDETSSDRLNLNSSSTASNNDGNSEKYSDQSTPVEEREDSKNLDSNNVDKHCQTEEPVDSEYGQSDCGPTKNTSVSEPIQQIVAVTEQEDVVRVLPNNDHADKSHSDVEGGDVESCNYVVLTQNDDIVPPQKNIVSPHENQIVSPYENQIVSPHENQIVSPHENPIVSPHENQVVSPHENEVVSPHDNQAVSPIDNQVVSPNENQSHSSDGSHVQSYDERSNFSKEINLQCTLDFSALTECDNDNATVTSLLLPGINFSTMNETENNANNISSSRVLSEMNFTTQDVHVSIENNSLIFSTAPVMSDIPDGVPTTLSNIELPQMTLAPVNEVSSIPAELDFSSFPAADDMSTTTVEVSTTGLPEIHFSQLSENGNTLENLRSHGIDVSSFSTVQLIPMGPSSTESHVSADNGTPSSVIHLRTDSNHDISKGMPELVPISPAESASVSPESDLEPPRLHNERIIENPKFLPGQGIGENSVYVFPASSVATYMISAYSNTQLSSSLGEGSAFHVVPGVQQASSIISSPMSTLSSNKNSDISPQKHDKEEVTKYPVMLLPGAQLISPSKVPSSTNNPASSIDNDPTVTSSSIAKELPPLNGASTEHLADNPPIPAVPLRNKKPAALAKQRGSGVVDCPMRVHRTLITKASLKSHPEPSQNCKEGTYSKPPEPTFEFSFSEALPVISKEGTNEVPDQTAPVENSANTVNLGTSTCGGSKFLKPKQRRQYSKASVVKPATPMSQKESKEESEDEISIVAEYRPNSVVATKPKNIHAERLKSKSNERYSRSILVKKHSSECKRNAAAISNVEKNISPCPNIRTNKMTIMKGTYALLRGKSLEDTLLNVSPPIKKTKPGTEECTTPFRYVSPNNEKSISSAKNQRRKAIESVSSPTKNQFSERESSPKGKNQRPSGSESSARPKRRRRKPLSVGNETMSASEANQLTVDESSATSSSKNKLKTDKGSSSRNQRHTISSSTGNQTSTDGERSVSSSRSRSRTGKESTTSPSQNKLRNDIESSASATKSRPTTASGKAVASKNKLKHGGKESADRFTDIVNSVSKSNQVQYHSDSSASESTELDDIPSPPYSPSLTEVQMLDSPLSEIVSVKSRSKRNANKRKVNTSKRKGKAPTRKKSTPRKKRKLDILTEEVFPEGNEDQPKDPIVIRISARNIQKKSNRESLGAPDFAEPLVIPEMPSSLSIPEIPPSLNNPEIPPSESIPEIPVSLENFVIPTSSRTFSILLEKMNTNSLKCPEGVLIGGYMVKVNQASLLVLANKNYTPVEEGIPKCSSTEETNSKESLSNCDLTEKERVSTSIDPETLMDVESEPSESLVGLDDQSENVSMSEPETRIELDDRTGNFIKLFDDKKKEVKPKSHKRSKPRPKPIPVDHKVISERQQLKKLLQPPPVVPAVVESSTSSSLPLTSATAPAVINGDVDTSVTVTVPTPTVDASPLKRPITIRIKKTKLPDGTEAVSSKPSIDETPEENSKPAGSINQARRSSKSESQSNKASMEEILTKREVGQTSCGRKIIRLSYD